MESPKGLTGLPQILLVGAQTIPNLLMAKMFKTPKVALVHSAQEDPARIEDILKLFNIPVVHKVLVNPFSYQEVHSSLAGAIPHLSKHGPEWLINCTGGTKPMSIGVCMPLAGLKTHTCYFDPRASNGLPGIVIEGRQAFPIHGLFSVKELLMANGLRELQGNLGHFPTPAELVRRYFHFDTGNSAEKFQPGFNALSHNSAIAALKKSGSHVRGYLLESLLCRLARNVVATWLPAGHDPADFVVPTVQLREWRMKENCQATLNTTTDFDLLISDGLRLNFFSCKVSADHPMLRKELIAMDGRRRQIGGIFCNAALVNYMPSRIPPAVTRNTSEIAHSLNIVYGTNDALSDEGAFRKTFGSLLGLGR